MTESDSELDAIGLLLLSELRLELGDGLEEVGWVVGFRVVLLELRVDIQYVEQTVDGVVFESFLACTSLILNEFLLQNCVA